MKACMKCNFSFFEQDGLCFFIEQGGVGKLKINERLKKIRVERRSKKRQVKEIQGQYQ
jgi:hypothetical protein